MRSRLGRRRQSARPGRSRQRRAGGCPQHRRTGTRQARCRGGSGALPEMRRLVVAAAAAEKSNIIRPMPTTMAKPAPSANAT
ncbi:hypothetical protein CDS [Bradyrhizobium sp.]|nr:hypothetical protein CDS [Bradyrhizobium sp.]